MTGTRFWHLVLTVTATAFGAMGPAVSAIAAIQTVDATLSPSVSVSSLMPAHEPTGHGTAIDLSVTGVVRVSANAPWVLTARAGAKLENLEVLVRARSMHDGRERVSRTRLEASDRMLARASHSGSWVVTLDIAVPAVAIAPSPGTSGPARTLILTLSPAL